MVQIGTNFVQVGTTGTPWYDLDRPTVHAYVRYGNIFNIKV
jgi:hypothetical protein